MNIVRLASTALLLVCAAGVQAQDAKPYKEGPVVEVNSIKIEDGQFENYLEYLSKTWRSVMEENKKAGLVLDYHVLVARAHDPDEPDLYLVVLYPNMATLDDADAKFDPIAAKVTQMNYRQQDEASGKRTRMRTLLGSELLREVVFTK